MLGFLFTMNPLSADPRLSRERTAEILNRLRELLKETRFLRARMDTAIRQGEQQDRDRVHPERRLARRDVSDGQPIPTFVSQNDTSGAAVPTVLEHREPTTPPTAFSRVVGFARVRQ